MKSFLLPLLLALLFSFSFSAAAKHKKYPKDGHVAVYNNCGHKVFLQTVFGSSVSGVRSIKPGSWHSEPFQFGTGDSGVSIKMAKHPQIGGGYRKDGSPPPITQLEYKWDNGGKTLWYDVSNIDCGSWSNSGKGNCPFQHGGYHVDVEGNAGCDKLSCAPGTRLCKSAFTKSETADRVHGCQNEGHKPLRMWLCQAHD